MLKSRYLLGAIALAASALALACTPSQTEASREEPSGTPEAVQPADTDTTPPADGTPSPVTETAQAPTAARTGTFVSGEHDTQGGVSLVSQDGTQTLVFDDTFATSDGPDLVVVLHKSASVLQDTTPPAYPLQEGDYVVLAALAATQGSQEYTIPAEVNVADYQSVAVWCQEFNATFGVAPLN